MANEHDFTFTGFAGDKRDRTLRAMYEELPDFDDTDPISMVAGLIFLDQQYGVYQDGNIIVMAIGYAMWFLMMVDILDPEISALIQKEEELSAEDLTILQRPFSIAFTKEGIQYPAIVAGKQMQLRVMEEEESNNSDFGCSTASPDGKLVLIPS